jgi:hypothetical protein
MVRPWRVGVCSGQFASYPSTVLMTVIPASGGRPRSGAGYATATKKVSPATLVAAISIGRPHSWWSSGYCIPGLWHRIHLQVDKRSRNIVSGQENGVRPG